MAKLRGNYTFAAGDSDLFNKVPTENGYSDTNGLKPTKNGHIRYGYTKNGIPRRHVKVSFSSFFFWVMGSGWRYVEKEKKLSHPNKINVFNNFNKNNMFIITATKHNNCAFAFNGRY